MEQPLPPAEIQELPDSYIMPAQPIQGNSLSISILPNQKHTSYFRQSGKYRNEVRDKHYSKQVTMNRCLSAKMMTTTTL